PHDRLDRELLLLAVRVGDERRRRRVLRRLPLETLADGVVLPLQLLLRPRRTLADLGKPRRAGELGAPHLETLPLDRGAERADLVPLLVTEAHERGAEAPLLDGERLDPRDAAPG